LFRKVAVILISLIGFVAATQPIGLTGTVSNNYGKPITGAIVLLAGQNLTDTTDANGSYLLVGSTLRTITPPIVPKAENISLTKGIISLSLTKPTPIKIELFDLKGILVETALDRPALTGDCQIHVKNRSRASNIMAIRVSIGQNVSTFHCLSLGSGNPVMASPPVTALTGKRLASAKIQGNADSLKISAMNYISAIAAISSYKGEVNVVLDTLGNFSFFATSLNGLQALSGSGNGFGGDLRFGKTGRGAGLLGADSICQCLAERSMPGSKVKIWRAFLSAAKDANDNQVNAIDRIGTGPWYDRLGRLVSATTSDLLQDRPNGDPAIKNDLPNEDGVPNHQPDPNRPAVDNHQFITGSDNLGNLYSDSSTCEDWTSAAPIGGKPRCGLSWPKSGGSMLKAEAGSNTKNWVSAWDLWGCKPGLDLTAKDMRGALGVCTIGNGGGYGGFYCFALHP
jgi:hypothetical protein